MSQANQDHWRQLRTLERAKLPFYITSRQSVTLASTRRGSLTVAPFPLILNSSTACSSLSTAIIQYPVPPYSPITRAIHARADSYRAASPSLNSPASA